MNLEIKIQDGRWLVNDKPINDLTPNERNALDHHLEGFKNCLETANQKLTSLKKSGLKSNNHKFK